MNNVTVGISSRLCAVSAQLVAVFLFLCFFHPLQAQTLPELSASGADTAMSVSDSSVTEDMATRLGIRISEDGVDDIVTTKAQDSMVIDVVANKFYLYGAAQANYKDMEIKSGILVFDQETQIVNASATRDTADQINSVQNFLQGSEQFSFEELSYNFKSKRAIVRNARSQYGEGFVHSEQVKRNPDESIYGYKNVYTTCELDTPHFGIRANRIKVIPGRVIASGPANMEFEGIPTPLYLPFGLFPINIKQSSGFILPSYTMEAQRGLGLQRGGYYFAINDYIGTTVFLDIFSKGSYAVVNQTQYAVRYRYSGDVHIGYNFTRTGQRYDANAQQYADFSVRWSHQQNPKARPGTSFNASVNVVTSNYNRLNGVDMSQILNNSFQSSISYSKSWVGKPFTLSAALRHSQNTQSRLVQLTLPEVNFSVTQFNPFQFRKNVTLPRWYEKITTSYNVNLSNTLNFYDSTFVLNQLSASDFNNAVRHTFNIGAGYTLFKYFNLSFSIPYTEYWNTKQFYTEYNPSTGQIDSVINTGIYTARQFSASASINTRLYGMKMFRKGKIAGIRHVLTPGIGVSYMPGFARDPFNYFAYVKRSQLSPYDYVSLYNTPYAPFGGPTNANPVGALNFELNNNLAIKLRGNDTAESVNVNLIDRFSINSSYNFFADSQKLSNIVLSLGSRIKEAFIINAGAGFDPYFWENGLRTRHYLIDKTGRPANFQNGNISLGFSFRGDKKDQKEFEDEMEENEQLNRLMRNGGYQDYYDFNVPYDVHVSYSMNANRTFRSDRQSSFIMINHSVVFGGQVSLTDNWRLTLESGYNITQNQMSTTSINISRDLHCWQMMLNLVPFGPYRSFNFTLNAKSSVLQDLKLIRRKSYLDN